jgi:hypothetical protein
MGKVCIFVHYRSHRPGDIIDPKDESETGVDRFIGLIEGRI